MNAERFSASLRAPIQHNVNSAPQDVEFVSWLVVQRKFLEQIEPAGAPVGWIEHLFKHDPNK